MARITYRQPDGLEIIAELADGTSLMQGAIDEGLDGIVGECGGNAMCATCHVYVDEGMLHILPEPSVQERELLDGVASDRQPNSRLGCQIKASQAIDGLYVRIPASQ